MDENQKPAAPASIIKAFDGKQQTSVSYTTCSLSNNMLREHALHLDPLNTNNDTHRHSVTEPQSGLSTASTQVDSPQALEASSPQSPQYPMKLPKSFLSHRQGVLANDSVPDQTILKPLLQRPPQSGHDIIANAPGLLSTSSLKDPTRQLGQGTVEHLSAAISDFHLTSKTPSTAKFSSIQSPCFFHQRFDDAVNIDRVLEEVAAESDGMSHSRLIQTATSVREISKQLQRRPIRRAVRAVMIVTKARDNSLVLLTRDLAEWLLSTPRYGSNSGVTVYVDAKLQTSKRFNAIGLLASYPQFKNMLRYWTPDLCWSSPEKFDLVLTLGGDGTVLFTSCLFQRVVPPILAFSLGSLGFLTNFEFDSYKSSLNQIMGEAGMRVNLRMRFTCTVYRANLTERRNPRGNPVDTTNMVEGEQFEVLNELVIDRGPSPYVSNLELYGDDELLTVVQADGCIFSTPTGSTAYSLSAGGPLTHPSIPGIVLTPICPHTLSFRPMVLSDSLLLKVCVPRNSRSTAYASFDGKSRVELRRGDFVQVEAGRYPFPTVVGEGGTGGEWFESVRRALRWNTRGAVQKSFHAKRNIRTGPSFKAADTSAKGTDFEEENRGEDEEQEEEDEDEEWDITADPLEMHSATDSVISVSQESSGPGSPLPK